jgi:hypothetical protein
LRSHHHHHHHNNNEVLSKLGYVRDETQRKNTETKQKVKKNKKGRAIKTK